MRITKEQLFISTLGKLEFIGSSKHEAFMNGNQEIQRYSRCCYIEPPFIGLQSSEQGRIVGYSRHPVI